MTKSGDEEQRPVFTPILCATGLSVFLLSPFMISKHSIPASDIIFAVAYPLYIYLANTLCFNSNVLALSRGRVIESLGHGQFLGNTTFKTYMKTIGFFTVLLPIIFVLVAPQEVTSGAVSPLMLLVVQIATERKTKRFHDALRILVPMGFNAYRLKSLYYWVETAMLVVPKDQPWYYVSLVFSLANLCVWTYNLFVFLLLRVLPAYFDKDYTPPVEMAYTVVPIPKTTMTQKND
mmetsp:Transcript_8441/g.7999  ORF Transcript_8441/g.7999 Transcript_8441/m.7999 type:complete len:234 (-) Transcript_8441:277-978(-)